MLNLNLWMESQKLPGVNSVHFTQMASTVTRSQSNRAPWGCGGTGDSHHGCAADKSAATA